MFRQMSKRPCRIQRLRRLKSVGFIAALAILLPALIPAGYMPKLDMQAGSLSIMVCPEDGCAFGAAAGPIDLGDDPVVTVMPAGPVVVVQLPRFPRRAIDAGPPLPARGPPPHF